MLHPRKLSLAVLSLLAIQLVACSNDEPSEKPAKSKKPAATKPAAAKPASGGKLPDVMTPDEAIDRFKANKSSMMGKTVKIKGYYFNYTSQGDQLNVDVTGKPDISAKGTLCIFPSSAKGALDKLKQKSMITVSGTVDGEFFGRPKLKDCKLQ
jgi:hypothetical protein